MKYSDSGLEKIDENTTKDIFFNPDNHENFCDPVWQIKKMLNKLDNEPGQEEKKDENDNSVKHVVNNTFIRKVYSFEIKSSYVGAIQEAALHELNRPLLTEYDYNNDFQNPTLDIKLKQTTRVRYYQQRALSKMFQSGCARSGIIVLPCGAGKTLTGIAACVEIKKSTLILTSNSVAVQQWKDNFINFTTVDLDKIVLLTSDIKSKLPESACVVCTTYTMISFSGKRSIAAEEIMDQIRKRDWGLLIFDEVQFAPAPAFRRVTKLCRSHCKLGLTATLVREDNLIDDLQWMIGPKLDEANWQELQKNQYLARAKCSEIWCPMTFEFYRAFIVLKKNAGMYSNQKKSSNDVRRKLWTCNPNKLCVCEYLIKFHEQRGDKIIVFSDYLMALKEVAITLNRPFLSGDVMYNERIMIIEKFKNDPKINTIFLSKVGDNAIDIPSANVVIQIAFNYASRRQETQRLGRILRPKKNTLNSESYNAFFYSLASQDTPEIMYADKRQQYIIDQGYAYEVIKMDDLPLDSFDLIFKNPNKQREILENILMNQNDKTDAESKEESE
uniref:General transcription and DNA repair factor IIH helicase/translocase subunit XPB n=1 Tax=Dermatophagoides pteronyssinus TaxID=6956 RepID=A0A6P6XLT6_DERPT|nr:general transcription and DNA repair factor IIH helicase subunit XPB-like [Dermatophagoides pteronyssinus]